MLFQHLPKFLKRHIAPVVHRTARQFHHIRDFLIPHSEKISQQNRIALFIGQFFQRFRQSVVTNEYFLIPHYEPILFGWILVRQADLKFLRARQIRKRNFAVYALRFVSL